MKEKLEDIRIYKENGEIFKKYLSLNYKRLTEDTYIIVDKNDIEISRFKMSSTWFLLITPAGSEV